MEVYFLCSIFSLQTFTTTEISKWIILSFRYLGKKVFLHFVNIFISNIVGNIFLSSYISENKPWGNLQSRFRVKDVLKVSYFLFPKSGKHCVKVLNCIHLYLRSEILQHGYACTNSLVFGKKAFFLN